MTGPVTTAFQGTVTLPVQGIGYAGPLPWNIVIPFAPQYSFTTTSGNLLIDIVGANTPGGSPTHFLDTRARRRGRTSTSVRSNPSQAPS